MSGMGDWWPWASFAMGVFAYVISRVVGGVLQRRTAPVSHRLYRERIVERLHYYMNLQAEIADVEQELAELWGKSPDKQARFIVDTVERARTLPRAFLRLAVRFGFDVPDGSLEEPTPEPIEEAPTSASGPRLVERDEDFSQVVPWTGRTASGDR